MHRSELKVISVVFLLLFSLSVGLAAAQIPYIASKTTDVTFDSNGLFVASEPSVGVAFTIEGTPGAVGTVTTVVYNGNPQATALVPEGVSLRYFIAITFDISADDFTSATVAISYNDNELAGLDQPYAVYKYLLGDDSFVELPTILDTSAKTLTITLNSVDDPLLAVGGIESVQPSTTSTTTWIIVAIAVVIIVLLALFLVLRWRRM